jgi:hypothetical protein
MKTVLSDDESGFRCQPSTPARILFDSSLSSARPTSGDAKDRHLLFVDRDFDIHMKVVASGSRKQIIGQVIPRALANRSVRVTLLVQGESLQATTATEDFGEFRFDQVPAGDASIEIVTDSRCVILRLMHRKGNEQCQ